MALAEKYAKNVYQQFRIYFANWEPGRPVQLGDYGLLRNDLFERLGNIAQLQMTFEVRLDTQPDHKYFNTMRDSRVSFLAKGSPGPHGQPLANASIAIDFNSEDAIFFNTAECCENQIADKVALGRQTLALNAARQWDKNWVVVTDVVGAGATTIAVSGSKRRSFLIEADANVQKIDLADASPRLSISNNSTVAYKVVSATGLTPLIGLCGIKSGFLNESSKFEPERLALDMSKIANVEDEEVEQSID